jgi:hypothetical protein
MNCVVVVRDDKWVHEVKANKLPVGIKRQKSLIKNINSLNAYFLFYLRFKLQLYLVGALNL